MSKEFKRWHAYITPDRNSIPIGREDSEAATIQIDGRHLDDPNKFAEDLVNLLNDHELQGIDPDWLASLETYTTRYKDESGIERAVLSWENYERLLRELRESRRLD